MIPAADLLGTMLGTLFLTLGLTAGAAAAVRSARQDRTLLWFGVFTFLYGLRLIVRSHLVQAVVSLPKRACDTTADVITYVILVAAALLASAALGGGRRGYLRYLWMIDLAGAATAIAWDVAAGRTGAAMPLNRVLVVGNIVAAVVSVALDTRRHTWTRDGWIVLSGAAVFAAVAVVQNVRHDLLGPVDTEPLAMLLLMACVGYVVVSRVFQTERRVAAVGRELETARQIQRSILPKHPPAVHGLSIATHYDSMAEVAGDFYDFVVTPSGQLGVLVADVSGHGVPAALVASMVKIALAVQDEMADPGLVLTRMNRALCGRFELAYVTATFALIDPRARTLTYAAAGHPAPLLVRADGHVDSLDERGMVLGFLPDAPYASATVHDLRAGDRLVFYTDGITEASRTDGEFFGDRQFHEALTIGLSQPADRFLAALIDRARRWTGADFADDVTVVVVDCVPLPLAQQGVS